VQLLNRNKTRARLEMFPYKKLLRTYREEYMLEKIRRIQQALAYDSASDPEVKLIGIFGMAHIRYLSLNLNYASTKSASTVDN
jgi:hypothetical protein